MDGERDCRWACESQEVELVHSGDRSWESEFCVPSLGSEKLSATIHLLPPSTRLTSPETTLFLMRHSTRSRLPWLTPVQYTLPRCLSSGSDPGNGIMQLRRSSFSTRCHPVLCRWGRLEQSSELSTAAPPTWVYKRLHLHAARMRRSSASIPALNCRQQDQPTSPSPQALQRRRFRAAKQALFISLTLALQACCSAMLDFMYYASFLPLRLRHCSAWDSLPQYVQQIYRQVAPPPLYSLCPSEAQQRQVFHISMAEPLYLTPMAHFLHYH